MRGAAGMVVVVLEGTAGKKARARARGIPWF
jgi:hypothetical protein